MKKKTFSLIMRDKWSSGDATNLEKFTFGTGIHFNQPTIKSAKIWLSDNGPIERESEELKNMFETKFVSMISRVIYEHKSSNSFKTLQFLMDKLHSCTIREWDLCVIVSILVTIFINLFMTLLLENFVDEGFYLNWQTSLASNCEMFLDKWVQIHNARRFLRSSITEPQRTFPQISHKHEKSAKTSVSYCAAVEPFHKLAHANSKLKTYYDNILNCFENKERERVALTAWLRSWDRLFFAGWMFLCCFSCCFFLLLVKVCIFVCSWPIWNGDTY